MANVSNLRYCCVTDITEAFCSLLPVLLLLLLALTKPKLVSKEITNHTVPTTDVTSPVFCWSFCWSGSISGQTKDFFPSATATTAEAPRFPGKLLACVYSIRAEVVEITIWFPQQSNPVLFSCCNQNPLKSRNCCTALNLTPWCCPIMLLWQYNMNKLFHHCICIDS